MAASSSAARIASCCERGGAYAQMWALQQREEAKRREQERKPQPRRSPEADTIALHVETRCERCADT